MRDDSGITLLETLFVLLLVGLLFAFCPVHCNTVGKEALRVHCANNLKQIGMAMKMYADEHDETFPGRFAVMGRYVSEYPPLFICPTSGNATGTFETVDAWTDYVCVPGLTSTSAPNSILVYCHPKNHDGEGGNVLYADGHVEWFNAKKYDDDDPSFGDMMNKIREQLKP